MTLWLTIALACFVLTLVASTAAGAFFGLDRLEKVRLEHEDDPARLAEVLRDPHFVRAAFSVLLGLAEVGFSTCVVQVSRTLLPDQSVAARSGVAFVVSWALLFVLGEVPARAMGARHAEGVMRRLAPLYHGVLRLTHPLRRLGGSLLPAPPSATPVPLSTELSGTIDGDELRELVSEGVEAGTVEQQEQALIQNVLDFGDRRVRDVMTPIERVFSVAEERPLTEVTDLVASRTFSRVPVWRRDPRRIVGVLYAKDLLPIRWGAASPKPVKRLVRRPLFVVPQMRAQALLEQFKRQRLHMAIVVDAAGSAVGVCTMEDLLEELVGPITDFGAERAADEGGR